MPISRSIAIPWLGRLPGKPADTVRGARPYRGRSLMAKIVLAPTVLVMLVCFYGSALWTVYISMTRSFLLPTYAFAGSDQYERLFHTPRWQVAYGNMFLFGGLDIVGTLFLGTLLAVLLDRQVRFESVFRTSCCIRCRSRSSSPA